MIVCFSEKPQKNHSSKDQAAARAEWCGTMSLGARPRIHSATGMTEAAKLRYSKPKALRVKRLISAAIESQPIDHPGDGQFYVRLVKSARSADAGILREANGGSLVKLPEPEMAFENLHSTEILVPLIGCTVVSQHQVMSVDYADKEMVMLSHIRIGARNRVDMPLCAYLNYCDQYQMIAIKGLSGEVFSGDPKSLEWREESVTIPG